MGTGRIESDKAIIGQVNKQARVVMISNSKRFSAVQGYIGSMSQDVACLSWRGGGLRVRGCIYCSHASCASRQEMVAKQSDCGDGSCGYTSASNDEAENTTTRDLCYSLRRWPQRSLYGTF